MVAGPSSSTENQKETSLYSRALPSEIGFSIPRLQIAIKISQQQAGIDGQKTSTKAALYVGEPYRHAFACTCQFPEEADIVLAPSSHLLDGAKRRRLMQLIMILSQVWDEISTMPIASAVARVS